MTKSWEKAVPNEPFSSLGLVDALCGETVASECSRKSQGMNEMGGRAIRMDIVL
jgi:hypothetical protein